MREDYSEYEKRYKVVEGWLSDDERENISARKEKHDTGARYSGYGHDLMAAIARGHRNRARELAHAMMYRHLLSAGYGDANGPHPMKPRSQFAMALSSLIDAAAEKGVTEEEIRWALQNDLDSDDALSIAASVKRYGPKCDEDHT